MIAALILLLVCFGIVSAIGRAMLTFEDPATWSTEEDDLNESC